MDQLIEKKLAFNKRSPKAFMTTLIWAQPHAGHL